MNHAKRVLTISMGLCGALAASASPLTAEDYCSPKQTAPAGIKEMRPLADGESFAAISDDGRSIEIYSYKSGLKTGTLFSIDGVKGDLKIQDFEGYEISDNGKKILLWNNSTKIYRYSFTADYYVYDILRSTLAKVSEGGPMRGATMSHDGRMVAYQRDNNLFISNIDYKSDKAITTDGKLNEVIYGTPDWAYEEEFGVQNTMRWSADDNTLAFIRFDESNVPVYSFDEYGYYTPGDELGPMYPKGYSYKYPLAGYPNSTVRVLAYNVDNRMTKTMELPIGESDYVPSMEFDGDGVNLMVMVLNRDQNDLTLYRVNPGSTVAHKVLTEKSNAWLSPAAYQMVRYYSKSFVIGSERSGWRHLYEYDYNGNQLRQLTSGNWNVTDYYGKDAKSGTHFACATIRGAVNRNVISIDAKGTTVLNPADGTETASFSANYAYFVRKYSNCVTPPQYTICNSRGKALKNLEMNEQYAAKYASAPRMEMTKVPNAAGEEMDAYIIKPADFDPSRKYPLLMYQYNGPDSQLVLNSWKLDGLYYIAASGYVVAAVDGRGTGNRSREWANCVYMNLGDLETQDQLAGAQWLSRQSYIDPARTACFGWSYGGYMTLMELQSPDCRFKAGVSMAPVTDWRFYDSIYTERYMRTPQQNEAGYRSSSAIENLGKLGGRLLIMSGTSDDNVHFYNTLRYTSKLNSQEQMFDMMVMSGFEHSLRMTNARTSLYKKIVDFLDTHVKN